MTSITLIAISRPVDGSSPEDLITYCARVSNPKSQAAGQNNARLLRYLADHQHWSPFEMVSLTVGIVTTRDIARQILRHRSFSFQEFSQRYAEVSAPPVIREARLQDAKNRQNSIATDDEELQKWWAERQLQSHECAQSAYRDALDRGIAKEVARAVLPEGNTESTLYMSGTLRSFMHYVAVREGNGTQAEHIEVALGIKEILRSQFPALYS